MGIQKGKVLKVILIITMLVSIFSTSMVRLSFSEQKQAKTVTQILENYGKAVVLIATIKDRGETIGQGSGFIVSPTGVIVTNLHVIEGAYPAVVKLINGDLYDDISIVDTDSIRDIAIIKIKGWNLFTVKLGNSDNLKVGEQIVVIGNPEGLENTVSDGLISGIRDTGKGYKMHQISAPISPGSSGSPVFNMNGKVIGIATSSIIEGQNLNFSVPINYARGMISETPKMTLEEFAKKLPEFKPSPLRKKRIAGLREFLTRFNKIVIKFFIACDNTELGLWETSEPHIKKFQPQKFAISPQLYQANELCNDVYTELKELNCNDKLAMELKDTYLKALKKWIDGMEITLRGMKGQPPSFWPNWRIATEGTVKMRSGFSYIFEEEANWKFLVLVKDNCPDLEEKLLPFLRAKPLQESDPYIGFRFAYSSKKIMVMVIDPGSPGDKAGLNRKDVILGVHNGPSFPSIVEYADFIKTCKVGDIVPFLIDRDGEQKIIRVKLDRRP